MNCAKCNSPLPEGKLFCPKCGHLNETEMSSQVSKAENKSPIGFQWYRSSEGKWLAGVCKGFAHKLNFNVIWVRIAVAILVLYIIPMVATMLAAGITGGGPGEKRATAIYMLLFNLVFPIVYVVLWMKLPLVRTSTGELVSK
jgi:phage shock protein PspC (stress-responsive transcriptional regulator)